MGLKLKQYYRFQFIFTLNFINGVPVNNNDTLHVAWKTGSHKGKLKTHTLKLENFAKTSNISLWRQQVIKLEDTLYLDVDAQSFDSNPIQFLLKREKTDMMETLADFRTDLGLCANTVLTESVFSVDVPSKKFESFKANITVQYKLLEKFPIQEVNVLEGAQSVAGSVQELKEEIARVSNECLVLKTIVIDSQLFSKSDYWVEKLPDMELSLRQNTSKVDELSTYITKLLQETNITVLDDKIADLQTKFFAEQDKLRRLSDIYLAFSQNTTQELAKMRGKPSPHEFGDFSRSLGRHLSLHMLPSLADRKLKHLSTPPASPRTEALDLSAIDISPDNTPSQSPALCSTPTSSVFMEAECRAKFAQLDEYKHRLEQIESETQQLWPRLDLDEADMQQLHLTTEALKWEREKDIENFYLFQKSQSQLAEELTKLKLQVNDFHSLPRKMEQRVELLEVQMVKTKRMLAGIRGDDGRSISTPSFGSEWRHKQYDTEQPVQPQIPLGDSLSVPPYHWFLLDHCFMLVSDGDPAGDLLVPAFFLVQFCVSSLNLASNKDDWRVFDGLLFALHLQVKKHHKSPTHLLFWLANTSFILDQLHQDIFSKFKLSEVPSCIAGNVQAIVKELEGFIKTMYLSLAKFLSQVFEEAVKSFSLCSTGDYENEWVKVVLAKLEWLNTLLKSYQLKDSFIQNVFGDMYMVMDSTLFNLICSESSLCTPARANQVKYFISTLDNWACSEHPNNSKIIEKLCLIRDVANLILGPKGSLRESSFRKSLFPHLTDIQHKHLLTIFIPDSAAEKLPPTLLSQLSNQITYSPNQDALDHQAIFTSHELGGFFEPNASDLGPTGRFSPPTVADICAPGFAMVDATMKSVENVLACDAFTHWGYLYRELQKWPRSAVVTPDLPKTSTHETSRPVLANWKSSSQSEIRLVIPRFDMVTGLPMS